MKIGFSVLALVLALGLMTPAFAQEDAKKEEPAKEEAKPAAEATPAAEAKPAAEAAPAPAKELSGCAKAFVPLSDTYKSAYDDMQKWISQIDAQTSAASAEVEKAQAQIKENETAVTQAKLNNDDSKVKSLQKEGKKLWDDFNAAKKSQSDTCAKFAKDAPQKVKQYADATSKALDALKAQTK